MDDTSLQNEATSPREARRRGEPWALGTVLGYALANVFDDIAMKQANSANTPKPENGESIPVVLSTALGGALLGTALRGLPSLLLGIVLMWKPRTLNQLR